MRIKVEKTIDEYAREKWEFNLFETKAVLVYWAKEVKPKGKKKWRNEAFWDKYGRRSHAMLETHPPLSDEVRHYAMTELVKQCSVMTWDEWKPSKS